MLTSQPSCVGAYHKKSVDIVLFLDLNARFGHLFGGWRAVERFSVIPRREFRAQVKDETN
jgi:hypothetical protein